MKEYILEKKQTVCEILDNGDWLCHVDGTDDYYTVEKKNQENFTLKEK